MKKNTPSNAASQQIIIIHVSYDLFVDSVMLKSSLGVLISVVQAFKETPTTVNIFKSTA